MDEFLHYGKDINFFFLQSHKHEHQLLQFNSKMLFCIHTSPPVNFKYLFWFFFFGHFWQKPYWFPSDPYAPEPPTPRLTDLAVGGKQGQGMRRGMYPGGGNWHCRGLARAGLACCHRQTCLRRERGYRWMLRNSRRGCDGDVSLAHVSSPPLKACFSTFRPLWANMMSFCFEST